LFQSPSLRGSGRFAVVADGGDPAVMRFNPLHCGAVVASEALLKRLRNILEFQSPSLRGSGRFSVTDDSFFCLFVLVSIPFIAGQWSLRGYGAKWQCQVRVSIPFIAGQWSLRGRRRPRLLVLAAGFNPLHCGAVVASHNRRLPSATEAAGLNPLHCGAVVASGVGPVAVQRSQARLNPLHCGAVVASIRRATRSEGSWKNVSIPFIAGQWSLLRGASHAPSERS